MIKRAIRAAASALAVAATISISDLTDGKRVIAISSDITGVETTLSGSGDNRTGMLPDISVAAHSIIHPY